MMPEKRMRSEMTEDRVIRVARIEAAARVVLEAFGAKDRTGCTCESCRSLQDLEAALKGGSA